MDDFQILNLSTVGNLCDVIENKDGLLARITMNNSCEEFHFDCAIGKKLQLQFLLLKKELSRGKKVVLQFSAAYSGVHIHNCLAEDDPARLIGFKVELKSLNVVLVDGKQWVSDSADNQSI
jgi:hypothetical protein